MSNIALSWAFRCHVGNATAKAVLVYLADRASDDGNRRVPKIRDHRQRSRNCLNAPSVPA